MTDPHGEERAFTINELADEAGVTRRTVHYYIAQGLLPASGGEGRNTRYARGHLDRLRLIRELQRQHLPLAEIRQRLERLTDAQVADLARMRDALPPPRGSAFDYIQSVLAGTRRPALAPVPPPMAARVAPPAAGPPPAPGAPWDAQPAQPAPRRIAEPPSVGYASAPPPMAGPDAMTPSRSQWERISLAPDIELHVRRPLSRIQNRAVDKLVGLARQLLEEDPQ